VLNLRSKKTKEEFVKLLWDGGRVNIGENLVAKSEIAKNAYERWDISQVYKKLASKKAIHRSENSNQGYKALVSMEQALKDIA
jgi:hypothetical protein